MDRYLVTHSLLSSWLYGIKDDPYADATTERDPEVEFLHVLRREPTPRTEPILKGIAFEDLVTDIVQGKGYAQNRWFSAAQQIAGIIKGGVLQPAYKRETVIDGRSVLLYGRLDALKAGVIYDIKFSGNYDVGKFVESTQHPMYLALVPEAYEFSYLVSNGTQVWKETYARADIFTGIEQIVSYFFQWLELKGLDALYRQYWLAR
ncbi:MAG: hypothetical protein RR150_10805 [Clostridia bacterium]